MSEAIRKTESIFWKALAMPSAAERAQYLDEACGGVAAMRAQIEELLAAYPKVEHFLEAPAAARVEAVGEPKLPAERPGTRIGSYKLLQQIGEGGMGVVYMAEQERPVRRKVALKIMKPGMDTRQVIARFEAERQALAMMDHQNIARVLDAGTTASGRPYFVMELVRGIAINKFCDDNHLTPRERLELFVPVCQAIQHAHQKGIIHRDVKPSNILVALYDGKPVPKVIDFGVAKAIQQRLTERTLFTQFGQVVGTVEYMSPEQAEHSALDIDTRSDIYSLGVLLYELLTGSTPLEKQKLGSVAFHEMLRMIREEEPPRPSTRLSASKDQLPAISAQRKMEPAKLTKLVRGELDWIVMKALEKDRGRRYETANGLAMDVQRYLADEPVVACPPSAVYRLRKLVRRNKRLLAAVVAIAASLLVGLAVAAWLLATHAIEMREEHKKTSEALEQAQGNLALALEALDDVYMRETKDRARQDKRMAEAQRESVLKGLQFYERFAQQNAGHEELQRATAKAYRRAGFLRIDLEDWTGAQADFGQAIAILEKWADESHGSVEDQYELARSCYGMTRALRTTGQDSAAAPICRRAIALCEKLSPYQDLLANCLTQWAGIMSSAQQPDQAEEAMRKAVGLLESLVAEYPPEPFSRQKAGSSDREHGDSLRSGLPPRTKFAECLGFRARNLAFMLPEDRSEEKAALFQKGADAFGKLAAAHPDVPDFLHFQADTRRYLGDVLSTLKRDEEAEKAYRQAMDLFQKLPGGKFAPGMQRIISEEVAAYSALANFLMARERSEDAVTVFRQANALYEKFPNDPDNLWALGLVRGRLHGLLQELGQKEEATKVFREAVASWEKLAADFPTQPEYRQHAAEGYKHLAEVLPMDEKGKETCIREALRLYKALAADYPNESAVQPELAKQYQALGDLLKHMNRHKEGEEVYRSARKTSTEAIPPKKAGVK